MSLDPKFCPDCRSTGLQLVKSEALTKLIQAMAEVYCLHTCGVPGAHEALCQDLKVYADGQKQIYEYVRCVNCQGTGYKHRREPRHEV